MEQLSKKNDRYDSREVLKGGLFNMRSLVNIDNIADINRWFNAKHWSYLYQRPRSRWKSRWEAPVRRRWPLSFCLRLAFLTGLSYYLSLELIADLLITLAFIVAFLEIHSKLYSKHGVKVYRWMAKIKKQQQVIWTITKTWAKTDLQGVLLLYSTEKSIYYEVENRHFLRNERMLSSK